MIIGARYNFRVNMLTFIFIITFSSTTNQVRSCAYFCYDFFCVDLLLYRLCANANSNFCYLFLSCQHENMSFRVGL